MKSPSDRTFLLRRLHSLTGIVPIGGYLLFHLFENASARRGPDAFNATVEKIGEIPYIYALEIGVIVIPILFHGIYGLFITSSAKPNVIAYNYGRNWAYFFQRVTGVIAFLYIGFHAWTTRRWALFVKQDHFTFADMQSQLSDPVTLGIYVVGIVATIYHFTNGLWSFSITWGIVRSELGQRRLAVLTQILFLVLSVVGLDIILSFIRPGSFISGLG